MVILGAAKIPSGVPTPSMHMNAEGILNQPVDRVAKGLNEHTRKT